MYDDLCCDMFQAMATRATLVAIMLLPTHFFMFVVVLVVVFLAVCRQLVYMMEMQTIYVENGLLSHVCM